MTKLQRERIISKKTLWYVAYFEELNVAGMPKFNQREGEYPKNRLER